MAQARQMLESSGYDGSPVTLSIDSAKAEHQLIAVRIQAALREVGMPVEIETLPSPVFAERKVGKQLRCSWTSCWPGSTTRTTSCL